MIKILITITVGLLGVTFEQDFGFQPVSSCSNTFIPDTERTSPGNMYGFVIVNTDRKLYSLSLNFILERRKVFDVVNQYYPKNWLDGTNPFDDTELKIDGNIRNIIPGTPTGIPVVIKYNPLKGLPHIKAIEFNDREICREDDSDSNKVFSEQQNRPQPQPQQTPTTETSKSKTECGLAVYDNQNKNPLLGLTGKNTEKNRYPCQIAVHQDDETKKVSATITITFDESAVEQDRSDLISPCPNRFTFDAGRTRSGHIYGFVSIITERRFYSLSLNFILERKIELSQSWGQSDSSLDDTELIIDTNVKNIKPGVRAYIPVHIKYNSAKSMPQIKAIQLNGMEICTPEQAEVPNIYSRQPFLQEPISVPQSVKKPYQQQQKVENPPTTVPTPKKEAVTYSSTTVRSQSQQCGISINDESNSVLNRIHNRKAIEKHWPWQAAVYTETPETKLACGGTLITLNDIILAAHCVTATGTQIPLDKDILTVYLGKHNLKTSKRGVQTRYVDEIAIHPSYDPIHYTYDLAILKLDGVVPYTDQIRPACLWPEGDVDIRKLVGKTGVVTGWGVEKNGEFLQGLQVMDIPVVDPLTCVLSSTEVYAKYIQTNVSFCGGSADSGSALCNVDSSGGMVIKQDNKWYLRGITSVVVKNGNTCDPNRYIVFTDVAQLLAWIKEKVDAYVN